MFKADTEDGIKLCLSVNMLAEGIHDDIDGVIMLRNTISANMYFQMIGRAFACGKKTIPLIIDLVANSQFISDAVDNFPNELRKEIEKRKKECEKEGKEYDPGFDVDEFIVMDEFMDVVSGFRAIEERLIGREWTEEENKILREYYPAEGLKVMDRLNRTKNAIQMQAYKLGLKVPNIWTDREKEMLKNYYPIEGTKVKNRLSGRTEAAIKFQAKKLGLIIRNRTWTEKEDKILRNYYTTEGTKVKNRLEGRSRNAIKSRARKLGLLAPDSSWTDKEIEILKKYYLIEGLKVIDRLGGRSKSAIMEQARRLKIVRKNQTWTESKDEAGRVAKEKAKEFGKAI